MIDERLSSFEIAARNVDGLDDAIDDKLNNFTIDAKNINDLAEEIEDVIKNSITFEVSVS